MNPFFRPKTINTTLPSSFPVLFGKGDKKHDKRINPDATENTTKSEDTKTEETQGISSIQENIDNPDAKVKENKNGFKNPFKAYFDSKNTAKAMAQASMPNSLYRSLGKQEPIEFNPDGNKLSSLKTKRPGNRYVKKANETLREKIETHLNTLHQDPEWNTVQFNAIHTSIQRLLVDARLLEENEQYQHAYDILNATAQKLKRSTRLSIAEVFVNERLNVPIANFFSVLSNKLYRGGQPTKAGIDWLTSNQIKTIICLRDPESELETNYPNWTLENEKTYAESKGLQFISLAHPDRSIADEDTIQKFLDILRDTAKHPVFIHCAAGVGRTGIFSAIAMHHAGISKETILKESLKAGMRPDLWQDHAEQYNFIKQL